MQVTNFFSILGTEEPLKLKGKTLLKLLGLIANETLRGTESTFDPT